MQNPDAHRHDTPVSIGQHLSFKLHTRAETPERLSQKLGCSEEVLWQILNDTAPLTAEMALKLQNCWGICMKLLLDLQFEHQQWMAQQHPASEALSPEVR